MDYEPTLCNTVIQLLIVFTFIYLDGELLGQLDSLHIKFKLNIEIHFANKF